MPDLVNEMAVANFTDFVDSIAKLKAAVFRMHSCLCPREVAAIDVNDA